jgi:hypothetical protein
MNSQRMIEFCRRHGLTIVLLVAIGLASWWIMQPVRHWGDENHYTRAASGLAAGLSGEDSARKAIGALVDKGWFMPGTGVILSPIFMATDLEPGIPLTRAWTLLLNLLLLGLMARELATRFSPRAANVFLGICLVSPFYVAYLSGAWSDLIAVHGALLFVLWLDRRQAEEKTIAGAAAGLGVAAVTYLRGLYPPLLALPVATWIIEALHRKWPPGLATRRIAAKSAIMLLTFAVALAPWSMHLSGKFGPTLTVTSPKLSAMMWCTNPLWNPYLPPETRSYNWGQLFNRTQRLARKNGLDFTEQARLLTEKDCANMTRADRLQRNTKAMGRLFADPENFLQRFLRLRCEGGACMPTALAQGLLGMARYNWFALLGLGMLICLVPFGRSKEGSYLLPMHLKALVCLISVHPFVAMAHSRYHVALIPVFAMMAALVTSGHFALWRYDRNEKALSWLLAAGQTIPYLLLAVYLAHLVFWPAA